VLVPGVQVAGAQYRGGFAYTLAWWSGNRWMQRLGARLMGLPSRPERLDVSAGKTAWSARVAGLLELHVNDTGAQPDWPKVRALCPVLQQPLVAQSRDGSLTAAGLHWNLGDADMRECAIHTRIESGLLGGSGWQGDTAGTADPVRGGALRMGAMWTLTRGGGLHKPWGMWRSSPTLRLRADVSLSALDRAVRRPASGATAAVAPTSQAANEAPAANADVGNDKA
jgi:hypothetical protein